MEYFVVPDLHGNERVLRMLLLEEGLIDLLGGRMRPEVAVVQLGDAANCVGDPAPGEDDLAVLARVGTWIDVMLVGNHEHPYWGGGQFWGFVRDEQTAARLAELDAQGLIKPAFDANGVLLSHAGVTVDCYENLKNGLVRPNTADVMRELQARWDADPRDPVFNLCGHLRGGRGTNGGILWSDCAEWKCDEIMQVFGHTPGREDGIREGHYWWCIDLGQRPRDGIAGAWIDEHGSVRTVVHEGRPDS